MPAVNSIVDQQYGVAPSDRAALTGIVQVLKRFAWCRMNGLHLTICFPWGSGLQHLCLMSRRPFFSSSPM